MACLQKEFHMYCFRSASEFGFVQSFNTNVGHEITRLDASEIVQFEMKSSTSLHVYDFKWCTSITLQFCSENQTNSKTFYLLYFLLKSPAVRTCVCLDHAQHFCYARVYLAVKLANIKDIRGMFILHITISLCITSILQRGINIPVITNECENSAPFAASGVI